MESVQIDVGVVRAVVVIGDLDVDVLANVGRQVYDLGNQVVGNVYAVTVLVGNSGQNGVRAGLDELHIHLLGVLAGAHLEGDEAVAAQGEYVGGQRTPHGRVAALAPGEVISAGFFHHSAIELLVLNQTADVEGRILPSPAVPLAVLVLQLKVAVGNVRSDLLAAAAAGSHAANHGQRKQESE